MVNRTATEQPPPACPPSPAVPVSAGPLGAVQAADREIARQTALRARAVAAFAAARPADVDRPQGAPGAMSAERWAARPPLLRPVSEWAAQELVVALSITTEAAEALLLRCLTLVHRLPGTLAALESGALHAGHLWPMLAKVAPIADPAVRAEVEQRLLAWAAGRVTTPAQLGAKARREVLARDARGAARRLAEAIAQRGVFLRPETTEGMASVTAVLTTPEAHALYRTLGALADALDDDAPCATSDHAGDAGGPSGAGGARTRGQKMADCLMDLVLRPGESDLPPVQVLLTVVAAMSTLLGGDAPGEVDGQVVPAEMIRDLLRAFAGSAQPATQPPPAPADADAKADADAEAEAARTAPEAGARTPPTTAPCPSGGSPAEPYPAETPRTTEPTPAGPFPAGPAPAGPAPAGSASAHTGPAPTGPLPADTGLGPDGSPRSGASTEEPGWRQAEQEDLQRWWAEVERRIVAGELQGEPDPIPDCVLAAWAAEEDRRRRAGSGGRIDSTGEVPRSAADDLEDPEVFDRGPGGHRAAEPDRPDRPDRREQPRAGDGRWWAVADRAVEDAGIALRDAQQALGHARRLVDTAGIADAADEAGWHDGPGGRITAAEDALAALGAATEAQRAHLADLLHATGGGGFAERPRIALTDALTGTLLALSDLPELRRTGSCGARGCRRHPDRCTHDLTGRPGLGPPGPTDGYRPAADLDRYLRARDRRCRFPGCRRRVPAAGELDHDRPYPDGPTSAENLTGFCTGHHRGKHQAPGWQYTLAPDGTLTVITPTGLITTTEPPPY